MEAFKLYFFNLFIAIDQLCNTLFKGNPDETLSSRCYRNSYKYWYANYCRMLLDFIFRPFGPEHCKQAYESELNRKHNFKTEETDHVSEDAAS